MSSPVMLLNWNGWEDTLDCLRSLRAAGDVTEVWLVDNGSREDRSEEARAVYPGLRFLRWDANYGYAGGYNRAFTLAVDEGYEFAYLLNNDCLIQPGFLDATLAAARADARLAAVGSRIAWAEPPGFVQYDGIGHPPGSKPLLAETGPRPVEYVVGTGMLVRLAAVERDGCFDERFFCYWEEIEWCFRMRNRGWSLAVCPESVVTHLDAGSNSGGNALYYRTRNEFLFLRLTCPAESWRRARAQAAYAAILSARAASLSGDHPSWEAIVAGLYDGLRGRFGKRGAPPHQARLRAVVTTIQAHAQIRDKWRSIRGLPPGYAGEA